MFRVDARPKLSTMGKGLVDLVVVNWDSQAFLTPQTDFGHGDPWGEFEALERPESGPQFQYRRQFPSMQ